MPILTLAFWSPDCEKIKVLLWHLPSHRQFVMTALAKNTHMNGSQNPLHHNKHDFLNNVFPCFSPWLCCIHLPGEADAMGFRHLKSQPLCPDLQVPNNDQAHKNCTQQCVCHHKADGATFKAIHHLPIGVMPYDDTITSSLGRKKKPTC